MMSHFLTGHQSFSLKFCIVLSLSQTNPTFLRANGHASMSFIHHNKPETLHFQPLKYQPYMTTQFREKGCPKITPDLWTPCSMYLYSLPTAIRSPDHHQRKRGNSSSFQQIGLIKSNSPSDRPNCPQSLVTECLNQNAPIQQGVESAIHTTAFCPFSKLRCPPTVRKGYDTMQSGWGQFGLQMPNATDATHRDSSSKKPETRLDQRSGPSRDLRWGRKREKELGETDPAQLPNENEARSHIAWGRTLET